jgi:hypothetical protein
MGLSTWAARLDRRAALMKAMVDRLGLDVMAVAQGGDGAVLRRAMHNCAACGATAECGAWLRSGGTSGDRYRFCPNADLFDRWRR